MISSTNNKDFTLPGAFQCFCSNMIENNKSLLKTDADPIGSDGKPICQEYASLTWENKFLSTILGLIITAINWVLRKICTDLVNWIGYRTESERVSDVAHYVFITNYVNITVLLLLSTANLEEQTIPLLRLAGFGMSPDFDASWFRTTGNLIV